MARNNDNSQTEEQIQEGQTGGSVLDTLDAKEEQIKDDTAPTDQGTPETSSTEQDATGTANTGQPAEPERTEDGGNGPQFEPQYDPKLRAELAKLLAGEKSDEYTLVAVADLQDRQDVFSTGLRTDRNGRQVELCRILKDVA